VTVVDISIVFAKHKCLQICRQKYASHESLL
jgi:hypothetical protein